MAINKAEEIYQRHIKELLPNERMKLLELIAHDLVTINGDFIQTNNKQRDWVEIRGKASYPLLGEDAQNWVSKTRKESDEQREKQSIHKI
jgi:hypothetical protein